MRTLITSPAEEGRRWPLSIVGIDLAKNVTTVRGVDAKKQRHGECSWEARSRGGTVEEVDGFLRPERAAQ
jgi:hypothetical protein